MQTYIWNGSDSIEFAAKEVLGNTASIKLGTIQNETFDGTEYKIIMK